MKETCPGSGRAVTFEEFSYSNRWSARCPFCGKHVQITLDTEKFYKHSRERARHELPRTNPHPCCGRPDRVHREADLLSHDYPDIKTQYERLRHENFMLKHKRRLLEQALGEAHDENRLLKDQVEEHRLRSEMSALAQKSSVPGSGGDDGVQPTA